MIIAVCLYNIFSFEIKLYVYAGLLKSYNIA